MCADTRSGGDYRFLYGRDAPPAPLRSLRAGPVTALFDGAGLRRVTFGGAEVVRRIFTAVRDVNWDTVQPARSGHVVDVGEREFRISYQGAHRQEELSLPAEVAIEGRADGTLRFTFHGIADSDFPYCRIGICVLHPPQAAGRPYRAESSDGMIEGELPTLVGPQWIREGKLQALFPPYRRLTIGMAGGIEVDFRFEGDLFEMEDQRNWTDASFKTYSTPLALGFPHQARRGQAFRQLVEVRCLSRGPAAAVGLAMAAERAPVALTVGGQLRDHLPAIGLGMSSVASAFSTRETALLRALPLDHLRVEAGAGRTDADLRTAVSACERLGTGLEVALFLREDPGPELERVIPALRQGGVRRFFIFKEGRACSDGALVRLVRERLTRDHPQARFFGGTNIYFAELNRARPDLEGMDGLVFTITPQIHDGDEMSVMENVEAQGDAVRSALAFAGRGRDVAVSPVTLKPRFNPFANRALAVASNQLPIPVDPRQATLFAAAWTVGSLKHLIEGGAAAVTYYETIGWRGLVEAEAGAPLPELFPSRPGMIFPVYWVFRDLAGWQDAAVLRSSSSDPRQALALALRLKDQTRVLVANLTAETQELQVRLDRRPGEAEVTLTDNASYDLVAADAGSARRSTATVQVRDGQLQLPLNPYAVARVDA